MMMVMVILGGEVSRVSRIDWSIENIIDIRAGR